MALESVGFSTLRIQKRDSVSLKVAEDRCVVGVTTYLPRLALIEASDNWFRKKMRWASMRAENGSKQKGEAIEEQIGPTNNSLGPSS